jgi:hypothetical protein
MPRERDRTISLSCSLYHQRQLLFLRCTFDVVKLYRRIGQHAARRTRFRFERDGAILGQQESKKPSMPGRKDNPIFYVVFVCL